MSDAMRYRFMYPIGMQTADFCRASPEVEKGEFVAASDYDALAAERDALKAKLACPECGCTTFECDRCAECIRLGDDP